jgi:hypothetical protein
VTDLIEALDQPGCPVCRLTDEAVDRFLGSVCYEQVNDIELRAELRAAGGFCRAHAYRFLHQPNGRLAAAIVYRDMLANAARRLGDGKPAGAPARTGRHPWLAALVGGLGERRESDRSRRPGCPACRVRVEAESRNLRALGERLADPSVQARYRSADGLCLPHLDWALERDQAVAAFVAEATKAGLVGLIAHLDEYIRKHDYRFRPKYWDVSDELADAPARAVERAVGPSDSRA